MALDGEVARSGGLSKNPCTTETFFQEKRGNGWGGGGRAAASPLQQQLVFIVMQISSCNLCQVQVHPVLVAKTETRMTSLLLTALNALLSRYDPRACFAMGLLLCLVRCCLVEHITDRGQRGGCHVPLPTLWWLFLP